MKYCHFKKCLTLAFIYLTISHQLCFLRKDRMELCGFANYRKGKQRTMTGESVHFLSRKSMLLVPKSAKAMLAFRVVFYF